MKMSRESIKKNFVGVLYEYKQYDNIAYEGDVVLEFIDNDLIDGIDEIMEMEVADDVMQDIKEFVEGDTVKISDVKVVEEEIGKGLSLKINDKEFRYVSDKFSVTELRHKLLNLLRESAEKGLKFLRENAINYWNEMKIKDKLSEEGNVGTEGFVEDEGSEEESEEETDEEDELEEKIEEWESRIEEAELSDTIQLTAIKENEGLIITVYEDKEGEVHEKNEILKDINEYVKQYDEEVDILENWNFDNDEESDISVWYTSFEITESEDLTEKNGFEGLDDDPEFESKVNDKMESISESVSSDNIVLNYVDFEVTEEDNVDIEFSGSVEEDVSNEEIQEYLEENDFESQVIDSVSEIVDDYEDAFLEFADIDVNIEGSDLSVVVEFKVVNDVGEEE